MKCHAVLDEKGQIVAAGYVELPEPEAYDYLSPRCGPMAEDGQTVVELEVPEEYAKLPLTDFIERLQVDAQAKLG